MSDTDTWSLRGLQRADHNGNEPYKRTIGKTTRVNDKDFPLGNEQEGQTDRGNFYSFFPHLWVHGITDSPRKAKESFHFLKVCQM